MTGCACYVVKKLLQIKIDLYLIIIVNFNLRIQAGTFLILSLFVLPMDAGKRENPRWNSPGFPGIHGRLLFAAVVVAILDGNIAENFRFTD